MLPKPLTKIHEPVIQPTPEEMRASKNAAGKERGCADCPLCGDSHWWKTFHVTEIMEGEFESDVGASRFDGSFGVSVICEDCWPKATPEQKMTHYMAKVDAWKADVKSVKFSMSLNGKLEDADDRKRYDADMAEIETVRKLIAEQVKAGN